MGAVGVAGSVCVEVIEVGYNLAMAHRILLEKGYGERMDLKPSYPAMLRHAVSKPEP